MKKNISLSGEYLIGIEKNETCQLETPVQFSEYMILLVQRGEGIYHADFASFDFRAPALLFATPLQTVYLTGKSNLEFTTIRFHSDFYCIEKHRDEVACNGLLFNNIYVQPSVELTEKQLEDFTRLLNSMEDEFENPDSSELVLRSYLQLFLAKCSTIKLRTLEAEIINNAKDEQMELFRTLLDANYLKLHKPSDYAELLSMTPNMLAKKSIKYFGKSPSQLIQDRLILEAKKMLHLTTLSIKEIAYQLEFNDEYYFSRFFKKYTQISPQVFRNKGGIAELAYLSKQ